MEIQEQENILDCIQNYDNYSLTLKDAFQKLLKLKKAKNTSKEHDFLELKANTFFTLKEMKNNHKDIYTVCYCFYS